MRAGISRLAILAAGLTAALLAGACGSGEGGEEAVRRDVTAGFDAIFDGKPDLREVNRHLPEECQLSRGALAQTVAALEAVVGDARLEIEITNVELVSSDRAVVTTKLAGGDLLFMLAGLPPPEGRVALWVLQGGRWRGAGDCEAFADEAAALGADGG